MGIKRGQHCFQRQSEGVVSVCAVGQVKEFTIDYTNCENLTPSTTTFETMPTSAYTYHVGSSSPSPPVWQFQTNDAAPVQQRRFCRIQFNVPETMTAPVFMYYKLSNYYQNHRRYVRSLDTNQLKGDARSYSDVQGGDCKPLDVLNGKPIYPCGLIANSVFNGALVMLAISRRYSV